VSCALQFFHTHLPLFTGRELCDRLRKAREQEAIHSACFEDLCGALDLDKVQASHPPSVS